MKTYRYLTIFIFISALLLGSSAGVQIKELKVPPLVLNGSGNAVTLDCEYSLEPRELTGNSLVVKWFHNNFPAPVYQWIPPFAPQDLGVLRGRLDLSYGASTNKTNKNGLRIMNPTTELSGEYKCSISTFEAEDFMIKRMIVFAPARNVELRHTKPTEDSVNVTCTAEGVYPEPRMALFYSPNPTTTESSTSTDKLKELKIESATIETGLRSGAYRIRATTELQDRDLTTPTEFHCELWVNDTKYHIRKSIVYYPGSPMPQPETGTSNGRGGPLGMSSSLGVLMPLVLCLLLLLGA